MAPFSSPQPIALHNSYCNTRQVTEQLCLQSRRRTWQQPMRPGVIRKFGFELWHECSDKRLCPKMRNNKRTTHKKQDAKSNSKEKLGAERRKAHPYWSSRCQSHTTPPHCIRSVVDVPRHPEKPPTVRFPLVLRLVFENLPLCLSNWLNQNTHRIQCRPDVQTQRTPRWIARGQGKEQCVQTVVHGIEYRDQYGATGIHRLFGCDEDPVDLLYGAAHAHDPYHGLEGCKAQPTSANEIPTGWGACL